MVYILNVNIIFPSKLATPTSSLPNTALFPQSGKIQNCNVYSNLCGGGRGKGEEKEGERAKEKERDLSLYVTYFYFKM